MENDKLMNLIGQYLEEHGYQETLKQFQIESGHEYDGSYIEKGGALLSLFHDYYDMKHFVASLEHPLEGDNSNQKVEKTLLSTMSISFAGFSRIYHHSDHNSNVLVVKISPLAQYPYIASGSTDKSVQVKNYLTGESICHYPALHKAGILGLDWHPSLPLLLTCSMDGKVHCLDISQSTISQSFHDHTKFVVGVCYSPSGKTFISYGYDHQLHVYQHQGDRYEKIATYTMAHNIESAIYRDEDTITISVREDHQLHHLTITSGEESLFNMNENGDDHVSFTVMDMKYSQQGDYLLVATDRDRAILINTITGKHHRQYCGALNDYLGQPRICFGPQEASIIATSQDKKVYINQIHSQKVLDRLEDHRDTIRGLDQVMVNDTYFLATCSYDKQVILYQYGEK